MGRFKRVGENMVRHQGSGTIYLRIKVDGKVIRESLQTDSMEVAKVKRDARVGTLRTKSSALRGKIRTVGEALELVRQRRIEVPHLKDSTLRNYRSLFQYLEETLPVKSAGRSWSEGDARKWWRKAAGHYAPVRANMLLAIVKAMAKLLIESGARADDPTEGLLRVKVVEKGLTIPTREEMNQIIASIRGRGGWFSEQSANMIGFLAFSGLRLAEAREVHWRDIGEEWVDVRGGVDGTKNRKTRRIPISTPLREILSRIERPSPSGRVFRRKKPINALKRACERLQLPDMRLHDLRHFFASWSLLSGVDVPTVSRWLGHSDGGLLVLKTYGHLWDGHSLEMGRRLK